MELFEVEIHREGHPREFVLVVVDTINRYHGGKLSDNKIKENIIDEIWRRYGEKTIIYNYYKKELHEVMVSNLTVEDLLRLINKRR